MALDFSVLWSRPKENAEPQTTTATAENRPQSHAEPPQSLDPSNYTPDITAPLESLLDPLKSKPIVKAAVNIIKADRENRATADGIIKQIEQDLKAGIDPRKLLLLAAEALDRMSGHGDSYIKRIEAAANPPAEPPQPIERAVNDMFMYYLDTAGKLEREQGMNKAEAAQAARTIIEAAYRTEFKDAAETVEKGIEQLDKELSYHEPTAQAP